jgi:hypothetical protein
MAFDPDAFLAGKEDPPSTTTSGRGLVPGFSASMKQGKEQGAGITEMARGAGEFVLKGAMQFFGGPITGLGAVIGRAAAGVRGDDLLTAFSEGYSQSAPPLENRYAQKVASAISLGLTAAGTDMSQQAHARAKAAGWSDDSAGVLEAIARAYPEMAFNLLAVKGGGEIVRGIADVGGKGMAKFRAAAPEIAGKLRAQFAQKAASPVMDGSAVDAIKAEMQAKQETPLPEVKGAPVVPGSWKGFGEEKPEDSPLPLLPEDNPRVPRGIPTQESPQGYKYERAPFEGRVETPPEQKTRITEGRVLGEETPPGKGLPKLSDRDSASQKISSGKAWDLTAAEKIAWSKATGLPEDFLKPTELHTFDPVRPVKDFLRKYGQDNRMLERMVGLYHEQGMPDKAQEVGRQLQDNKVRGVGESTLMYTFNPVQAAKDVLGKAGDFREALKGVYVQHGEQAARDFEYHYRNASATSTLRTAEDIAWEFDSAKGRRQNYDMEFKEAYQAAQAEGYTAEQGSRIQDVIENPRAMKAADRALYEKYVKPITDIGTEVYAKIAGIDPNDPILGEYHGRISADKGFWSRFFQGLTENPLGAKFGTRPSGLKARSIFQITGQDGNASVISQGADGSVMLWKNGEAHLLSGGEPLLKPGAKVAGFEVQNVPNQRFIEQQTGKRFVDDPLFVAGVKTTEMRKYADYLETLDKIMQSPAWKSMTSDAANPTLGHRMLQYPDRLPILRKYAFDPKLAEVFDDFLKPGPMPGSLVGVLSGLTNFAVKSFMLIPIKHINNEAVHYLVSNGISGMLPTSAKGKAFAEGVSSVLRQDSFQREMAQNGAKLLYPRTVLDGWMKRTMDGQIKRAQTDPQFIQSLKAVGMKPVEFFDGWSRASNMGMWSVRDAMYTALVKENMGKGMDIKAAIKETERFMPAYKIPSRVSLFGVGPKQRWVSQLMQNPTLTVFSSYHYGALKALGESVKGLATKGQRVEGLNHVAGYAFMMAAVYPMLDYLYGATTGDRKSEFRRPGGLHYIDSALKVSQGQKRPEAAFMSVLTPSPVPFALMQASPMFNTEIFTKKEIRNSQDPFILQGLDTAKFVAKQQFNPAGLEPVAEGRMTFPQWALSQLSDIEPSRADAAKKSREIETGKQQAKWKKRPEWERTLGRNLP